MIDLVFVVNAKRAEGGFPGQAGDGKRQSSDIPAVLVDATLLQVPCRVSEKHCVSSSRVSHPGVDVWLTAKPCICLV